VNPKRKHKSDLIWNILSILALVGILVVTAIFLIIYINPQTELNPWRPLTPPALAVFSTLAEPTETPVIVPLLTEEVTLTPSAANTSEPVGISPTITAFPPELMTEEPQSEILFEFEVIGESLPLPASEYDPARGCDWMGVAGQVFDIQGTPVKGIRVSLRAELEDRSIDLVVISGTAPGYGESGYEFRLSDRPIASSGQAHIQLIDQAGLPLSDIFTFNTFDDCDANLILIDFYEIR